MSYYYFWKLRKSKYEEEHTIAYSWRSIVEFFKHLIQIRDGVEHAAGHRCDRIGVQITEKNRMITTSNACIQVVICWTWTTIKISQLRSILRVFSMRPYWALVPQSDCLKRKRQTWTTQRSGHWMHRQAVMWSHCCTYSCKCKSHEAKLLNKKHNNDIIACHERRWRKNTWRTSISTRITRRSIISIHHFWRSSSSIPPCVATRNRNQKWRRNKSNKHDCQRAEIAEHATGQECDPIDDSVSENAIIIVWWENSAVCEAIPSLNKKPHSYNTGSLKWNCYIR